MSLTKSQGYYNLTHFNGSHPKVPVLHRYVPTDKQKHCTGSLNSQDAIESNV